MSDKLAKIRDHAEEYDLSETTIAAAEKFLDCVESNIEKCLVVPDDSGGILIKLGKLTINVAHDDLMGETVILTEMGE